MLSQKVPATVITGFLGAGKTTLIRNMLEQANGKRIALIINEFGDLGVDGGILEGCGIEGCSDEDMIELNNGCICCTVADDFLPAMEKLLDREDRPDHIVIETSGLALPQPLVNAFNWPGIKTRVTVDGVVTVVDSAAVAEGRFAHDHDAVDRQRLADDELDHETPLEELFEDQLTAADLLVFSKTDLVDADAIAGIEASIKERLGRPVGMVRSVGGNVPNEVLLGLSSATEDLIHTRQSHHERHHHHHDDDHDHDHDDHHHHHDHDHDAFESFVVTLGEVESVDAFVEALARILADHHVLRCKGFVAVASKPMRLTVQAVGRRIDHYFDRPFGSDPRESRLVVIGEAGLNRDGIEQAIRALAG